AFVIFVLTLSGSTAVTMRSEPLQAPQRQAKPPVRIPAPARANTAAVSPAAGAGMTDAQLTRVVQTNCATCHSDKMKDQFGNLSLQSYDVAAAAKNVEVSEKMIRKLRAGFMPPPSAPHPPAETLLALVERIESKIDVAAKLDPNPGSRSFQRLNRAEYKAAVKDLLGLDIDPAQWLPLDTMSGNFDNIADAQFLNPTVLEAYL